MPFESRFLTLKICKVSNTIIQGSREFLKCNNSWFIIKINGKSYNGKKYDYYPCSLCGQLCSHMMGGSSRHQKACFTKERIQREIQRLYDWDNFTGLPADKKDRYNNLHRIYASKFNEKFEPIYNCLP